MHSKVEHWLILKLSPEDVNELEKILAPINTDAKIILSIRESIQQWIND